MKVSARSAGGQVCILHLARFNDFPGAKIVAIEPVQKTKPREKMVYFSLTAKLEWLTLVRPAATARAHSRSRNAFGEKTLTSCLTRVGGPEITSLSVNTEASPVSRRGLSVSIRMQNRRAFPCAPRLEPKHRIQFNKSVTNRVRYGTLERKPNFPQDKSVISVPDVQGLACG